MAANLVGIFRRTLLTPACIGTGIFTLCYYPHIWSKWALSNYVTSRSAVTALSVLLGFRITQHLNSWLSQQAMNNFCTDLFIPRNEIVLITGGSRGIGAEMAKRFVKAGAKVVIMDLISPQYPSSDDDGNKRITFYKADISSAEDIHNVAERIRKEVGCPTVLINNAGIGGSGSIVTLDDAHLNKIFDVNIIAHFRLAKEFVPVMIERNHGHIINIASLASFVTISGNTAYSCTKTGVLAFTEGLRQELKHISNARKVRVTSVHPTWIRTPLIDHLTKGKEWNALTLEPEVVADTITSHVLSSNGGTLILPTSVSSVSLSRAYPDWLQEWLRDRKASLMDKKR